MNLSKYKLATNFTLLFQQYTTSPLYSALFFGISGIRYQHYKQSTLTILGNVVSDIRTPSVVYSKRF